MKKLPLYALTFLFLVVQPASAVILFGLDNDVNRTDPGTGLPFDSVGQLPAGTGIYVGNGYVLTANHVSVPQNVTITFDGITHYAYDNQGTTKIGDADLKVFKLTSTPTVAPVQFYTGQQELSAEAYLVGTGAGRSSATAVESNEVPWDANERAKRWGTNTPTGLLDSLSVGSYTYDALYTILGANDGTPAGSGNNEAAAAIYDSGSALFQYIDGQWQLTGLTTTVLSHENNTSTFGNDLSLVETPEGLKLAPGSGDANVFVRISPYANDIALVIPEPSSLLSILFSLPLLLRRRR